jgi:predicted ATPase
MLRRDGSNLASVLDYLSRKHPYLKRRIEQYLAGIVQGLEHVKKTSLGQWETIAFTQRTLPNDKTWDFQAASMSDGTLRSLGVLVALFQKQENGAGRSLSLVGIEEPEVALHPAAARLLLDALGEAAESRQVIVTTHSPDLLDSNDIDNDCILAVQMGDDGATQIGPVDDAGRKVLRDRLYTPGELMRLNQLSPKVSIKDGPSPSDGVQAELFPDEP